MDIQLNVETLLTFSARFAILSLGNYALPVHFRVRAPAVECLVPTWSGIGDLLEPAAEAILLAVADGSRWLYLRGSAALVPDPDWEGLLPLAPTRVSPSDLYQVLRIVPKRIEWVDEARGWGCRETADF